MELRHIGSKSNSQRPRGCAPAVSPCTFYAKDSPLEERKKKKSGYWSGNVQTCPPSWRYAKLRQSLVRCRDLFQDGNKAVTGDI
jgi:hypothetical protein